MKSNVWPIDLGLGIGCWMDGGSFEFELAVECKKGIGFKDYVYGRPS